MNISKNMNLSSADNLRDLGGIKTIDNRTIVTGRLYRSCDLSGVTAADLVILNTLDIVKVIDFRSLREQTKRPDVRIENCEYVSLPIMEELDSKDISKFDENRKKILFEKLRNNPQQGYQTMIGDYHCFAESDFTHSQYHHFIEEILKTVQNDPKSAVLWHCTTGKDRAGFGTVIVLEILGVDRNDIYEDYLSTNRYLKDEPTKLKFLIFGDDYKNQDEKTLENLNRMIDDLAVARKEYLDTTYQLINEKYGSFKNFLLDGLNITLEMQQKLKDTFLV